MRDQIEPKLSKWPFYLGDALLLGTAWALYSRSQVPLGRWEMALAVFCVAAGAVLAVVPYLLEYKAWTNLTEVDALQSAVTQIQNMESVATHIAVATSQWQAVHERADQTAETSRKIAERMAAEVKAFTDFLERANDAERANLRLEVEKLRRAESDWLQVLVRMLDHVFALYQGAVRSGQANVIEQVSRFQIACCDVARRVGLAPFSANPSDPLDPQRHQVLDGNGEPAADAVVDETVATGYTFQGQLLRPALVRLKLNGHPAETQCSSPIQPELDGVESSLPDQAADARPGGEPQESSG